MLDWLHTLRALWRMPHEEPEALRAFQLERLRSVLAWAGATVPYYRELFARSGLRPEAVRALDALQALPPSSSPDLRARPSSDVLSNRVDERRLVRRPTSGSSGRPFVIQRTALEDHLLNQFRIRAMRTFGLRIRDRTAAVGLHAGAHQRGGLPGRVRHALGIFRAYPVDSLLPTDAIVASLEQMQPDVVRSFPSLLTELAGHLRHHGRSALRPRLLTTGGETLGAIRRHRIEDGFGCRLFDVYGAHEFNVLAWECVVTGQYHVCSDNAILEVLKDGRPALPGETGDVVATGLHVRSMPFIRYAPGDVAVQGEVRCRCGAPFPTLLGIEGRRHDYFTMPDGSSFHPDRLVAPIMEKAAADFDRYRVEQLRPDDIVLRMVPRRPLGPEELAGIEAVAHAHLPAGVHFRTEVVDRLDPGPSGKFRFCLSHVPRV